MPSDLETMVHNQMRATLVHQLDSATQVGDIQAARRAAQQLSEFAAKTAKPSDAFTNDDIRIAIETKASWFGKDPRRSAKVVEFGKNMNPKSFKSAEEFADTVIAAVEEEFKTGEEPEEEPEDEPEEENEPKKIERKKTDAPSSAMGRAVPRRSSGPWTKLSDAPKEVAAQIKAATDKFTRNATKEQREKYVATALGTAYAADQRAKGRK